MAQELVVAPAGLWTDPSTLQAPQGALSDARNVVINRPGLVEPRPGLPPYRTMTGDWTPRGLKAALGTVLSFEQDGFGSTWRALPLSTGTTVDNNSPPSSATQHMLATARQSAYWTSKVGIRKLTSAAATAATRAGIPNPFFYPEMVASGSFAWPSHAYYQFCILRRDANGYEIRSAPSGVFLGGTNFAAAPPSTNPYSVLIRFCPSVLAVGDVIEMYRSLETPVAITPSVEVYLASTTTISAVDLANGSAQIIDSCSESRLGATLYTCPSQLGAERAYRDPPSAWDAALFAGSMVYARTTYRRSLTIVPASFGLNTSALAIANVGTYERVCDLTIGSPTLTNFVAGGTDAIEVGQTVALTIQTPGSLGTASAWIPANARVLSKTSTTVTMDTSASLSGLGLTVIFGDVITIAGVEFYMALGDIPTSRCVFTGGPVDSTRITSSSLAYSVNFWASTNGLTLRASVLNGHDPIYDTVGLGPDIFQALPSTNGVVVEDLANSYSSLSAYATHGGFISPRPLPAPSVTTNDCFHATEVKNGLAISEADLPEAVPVAWTAAIGDASASIIRLIALRDCLLIFKEDGLWRMTGTAPDNLTIDPVDPTLVLLNSQAVDVLDDVAYAVTNRGVVAVGPDGARATISDPIDIDIRAFLTNFPGSVWVACQDSDKQVVCGSLASSQRAHVYSPRTGGWTYWDSVGSWNCGAYDATAPGRLYVGTGFGTGVVTAYVRREERAYTAFDYHDGQFTRTVTSATASATQDAIGGLYDLAISATPYPAVGDYMAGGTSTLIVVEVIAGGVRARVFDTAFPPIPGVFSVWTSYPCTVQFVGKSAQNPGLLKTWREMSFGFQSAQSLDSATMTEFGDIDTSVSGGAYTLNPRAPTTANRQLRHQVGQVGISSVFLTPTIAWKQAFCKPLLSSVSMIYEPVSENVRSR